VDTKYHLIEAIIHRGTAQAGHYWVYTFAHDLGWVKFDDSKVTAATFERVKLDGFGGTGKSSAYCLVYAAADFGEFSLSLFSLLFHFPDF
jgi:ubiquitin C-terminal hydrolase